MGQLLARLGCRSAVLFTDNDTKKVDEAKVIEEAPRPSLHSLQSPGETVYVAVMGSTGSGKTTFINVASGSSLRVGMGLESCTNEVQTSMAIDISGKSVVLVDTPGFDDTTLTDTDVLKIIAAYLITMNKQGARLAGVLYMQRISDLKVGGSARRDLRMFQELCGEEAYPNVLVVTNMWSNTAEEDGVLREQELATKDIFYKPILDKHGKMMRHNNTQKSAHDILQHLIHRDPVVLRIQRELGEGIDITQTAAFKQLDRELSELAAQHQKDLEQLKADMVRAEQEMDEETRKELEDEAQKVQGDLIKAQTQASRLASEYQAELRRIEQKLHVKELVV